MVCVTVKEGLECFFMQQTGCHFNGGSCHQIMEQCEGCQKVQDFPTGKYCQSFPDPAMKWRAGICNMASHRKAAQVVENAKLNPLKASKRKSH